MNEKEKLQKAIAEILNSFKPEDLSEITANEINLENPPDSKMGDIGIPLFAFAKTFKQAPAKIAEKVEAEFQKRNLNTLGTAKAMGPYLNIFLPKENFAEKIIKAVQEQGEKYGSNESIKNKKIMIEFSSPNTNKPLHLGHLRNDALGESVSRILEFSGADVYKVNIVNNRGMHICKSMIAYKKYAEGKTPESENRKGDHFVGDMYVAFHKYETENPNAGNEVQTMLRSWEQGDDEELMSLWRTMNKWTMDGINETYKRTGISFDKIYYESDTYLLGKDEVLKGLEEGVFYKETDGSIWIDLSEIDLDKKILLRGDGTSIYITQDIGTAISRHKDWTFDSLIYVVASEQDYHFKVLFYVLKKLGFKWADDLYHLSYGMVNLPEGKMKSREGTVVDADNLLNSLHKGAFEEIKEKGREEIVRDPKDTAEKIALGALHYFLLQVNPKKDMLFDPKESLSFTGNTGPYLQYMGARICSILRKAETANAEITKGGVFKPELLSSETEWELLKSVENFPAQVLRAKENYDPSVIANYLYELAKNFSRFYKDCPILSANDPNLLVTRLELVKVVKTVLQNAMKLILVPFLELM
ncbi:MAG: arginine--tRNA ligase [Treponemataceae bacterium]